MDSELAQASSHGMGRMSAVVHNIPPVITTCGGSQGVRWQPTRKGKNKTKTRAICARIAAAATKPHLLQFHVFGILCGVSYH